MNKYQRSELRLMMLCWIPALIITISAVEANSLVYGEKFEFNLLTGLAAAWFWSIIYAITSLDRMIKRI